MKARKWIIQHGRMRLGEVEFHSELLQDPDKRDNVCGGRYAIFEDEKVILFFGSSFDFRAATGDEFSKAVKPNILSIYKVLFSPDEWVTHAISQAEKHLGIKLTKISMPKQ